MHIREAIAVRATLAVVCVMLGLSPAHAQEKSRYMGGEVRLTEAPNGAVVEANVLEVSSKIVYVEPTEEKVADGVWCIGGYSIGNSIVIEGDSGLIVYDTGDNKEEGEHLRKAIAKISNKPVKAIIYSHSHYVLGGTGRNVRERFTWPETETASTDSQRATHGQSAVREAHLNQQASWASWPDLGPHCLGRRWFRLEDHDLLATCYFQS